MERFYIPVGDWSQDGHGHYDNYLVTAPSMEHVVEAQKKAINAGFNFSENWASEFEDNNIHEPDATMLKDMGYDEDTSNLFPDEIFNAFVFVLNHFGADINICEKIPILNNWTVKGFKNVGYGCYSLD